MSGYELRITNIHGVIGINKNDAVLNIRQPRAQLEIETEPAQLNISTRQAQVKIDQSQCFSEAGLKSCLELTDEFAQRGQQAAMAAISEKVSEGNRMAMIKYKSSAIAEIAAQKAFPPPDEYNIALMPKSRPKIDFEGGISFNPSPGRVNIRAVTNPVEFEASPPAISFYWLRQPFFSMEFVGKNIDVNV